MKFKSFLAFVFTILALILIVSAGVWVSVRYFLKFPKRDYCEHFSVELKSELYEVELEPGKGKLVKMKMTNMGFEDDFRIKTIGPGWVVVKPEKIRLGSGESEDIFVYMSPSFGTEGKFDVIVSISSYCGQEEEVIKIEV